MRNTKDAPATKKASRKTTLALSLFIVGLMAVSMLILGTIARIMADTGESESPTTNLVQSSESTLGADIQVVKDGREDADASKGLVVDFSKASVREDEEPAALKTSVDTAANNNQAANVVPRKVWVEDTEQVWVVDQEAWTEQVSVYAISERSICNTCSADITGNTAAHGKAHMLTGENSGHHSEVTQYVSHYETVEHPEVAHWETVVVGGHWE